MRVVKNRIIKYYEFQMGNNELVGTADADMYDTEKVPKFYQWQADNNVGCRQLAGAEDSEGIDGYSGSAEEDVYDSDYGAYSSGDDSYSDEEYGYGEDEYYPDDMGYED